MATSLRIAQATGLDELAKWHNAKGQHLRFEIGRSSSFGLAIEGIAIGLLGELRTASSIEVECSFDVAGEHRAMGLQAQLGIFDGLFGLALIEAADRVTVLGSPDSRTEILNLLWQRVQVGRGEIGDGKRRSLVSRDPDEPVPDCLRVAGHSFPTRDRFGAILLRGAQSMAGSDKQRYSLSEEDAVTFIFEAARNSFEHARVDTAGVAVQGVRGILLEKLVFASRSEALSRGDLSELHREYIDRIWECLGRSKRALAYSVVDLGPGIHHTLPAAKPEESVWDRLERAFRPGETRKAKGTDMEAGMGLSKLCAAATRLRALLLVRSGELLAVADFSRKGNPDSALLTPWPEPVDLGTRGTSLTLLWPEIEGAGDQGQLF